MNSSAAGRATIGTAAFVTMLISLMVFAATSSAAGLVYAGGTRVTFKAGTGEPNSVTVTQSGGVVTLTDSQNAITAGSNCSSVSMNSVACSMPSYYNLSAQLYDGDDTIEFGTGVGALTYLINGGDGSDIVSAGSMTGAGNIVGGGGETEVIFGGAGDDMIDSGPVTGAVIINGGSGSDCIAATGEELWDAFPDEAFPLGGGNITGGPGDDFIDTTAMTGDAVVILHEGDDFAVGGPGREYFRLDEGSEYAYGGDGDDYFLSQHLPDTLVGSGDDYAEGGDGNDQMLIEDAPDFVTFDGGAGVDFVDYFRWNVLTSSGWSISLDNVANDGGLGAAGDNIMDTVEGVAYHAPYQWGPDTLIGSAADNILYGRAGSDSITGGAGQDELDGGGSPDVIYANDGEEDVVRCGTQTDTVFADVIDDVATDCENVTIM